MSEEPENRVFGDVCIRKLRRKRQKLLIIDLFLDYAKNSTLHGLRYIAERSLTAIEKIFWIVTFTISVSLCCYLIKNVYIKWKTSPVIVTVSERLVSVGEVPFPSVTICPQIKCMTTVYNFSQKLEEYTIKIRNNESNDEDTNMLADVSIVCQYDENIEMYTERNTTNATMVHNIDKVATPSSILTLCLWHNNYKDCDMLFKKVLTAEGVCFNMNGLAAEEMFRDTVQSDYNYSERSEATKGWSLEDGYNDIEREPFPLRGNVNGATPDLEIVLLSNINDTDVRCNGINSGYKIYMQNPADFPQSSMYYYAALNNQVSSLAVSFSILSTSDALKEYSAKVRQCYFPDDRPLRYFKIYTAKNCQAECLSNYTFERCGCVGYYMPHENSSHICAEGKFTCMEEAHEIMAAKELRYGLDEEDIGCRCLPACNNVEYDAEILKTDFNLGKVLRKIYNYSDFLTWKKFSKIEMYFKKPQFVSMRRSELFGLTDFMANIGGLLGVFLGFSFLSLIEIIYFVTLRLGFSLRRDLREEKKKRADSFNVGKNS